MNSNAMYVGDHPGLPADQAELVVRIAHNVRKGLPDSVQLDDLIQAGMLGLLEARLRYRADKGASFATFVGIRVRGAILDELRRGGWAPRSLLRAHRLLQSAQRRIEQRMGRPANEKELAAETGMPVTEIREMTGGAAGLHPVSLDWAGADATARDIPDDDLAQPPEATERAHLCAAVHRARMRLPPRQQKLMAWHYDEEVSLREIAERLGGVTQARVSQLHKRALSRVQTELSAWQPA